MSCHSCLFFTVIHLLAMYYTRRILGLYASADDAARARRTARPKAD